MRFLLISLMNGAPWGGSEVLWSETAAILARSGHNVFASVKQWEPKSKAISLLQSKGVTVVERPPQKLPNLKARITRLLGDPFAERLWRDPFKLALQQIKPDFVVLSNGGVVDVPDAADACLAMEIPYVNIAQANAESKWPDDHGAERIERTLLGAQSAFFVSHGNWRLTETQLGCSIPNAEVLWNPFNVSFDASPAWPCSNETFHFASVGRLEPAAKGQDLLLQVLATPTWRSRPFHLNFYGAGPNERTLRRLVSTLELEDRVTFVGHVSRVEDIWASNHLLVMPSRYEGLPLALVEAMLCNRPSVVTDVAGNAEPLQEGITGFIAEAPTVRLLAQALENSWERREEWQEIGLAAGKAIRALLPRDPAKAFADRILELAKSTRQPA